MINDKSQGSVEGVVVMYYYGLFVIFAGERIFKIGKYLAKLLTKVWVPVFIGPPCRLKYYRDSK